MREREGVVRCHYYVNVSIKINMKQEYYHNITGYIVPFLIQATGKRKISF